MTFHDYTPTDFPDDITPHDIKPHDPSPEDTPVGVDVFASAGGQPPPIPPVHSYSLRPRLRTILLTFLVHHNPFYLISALCMIAGCYILNAGLELRTGEVHRILILIGTLSLYELLLVALGLFLIRGRGILRDGRTLLLLQIVFLVDLTFLNAETVTVDLRTGIAVNAALLMLALFKVGAVMKWLSPVFPWRSFAMAGLMLTALFGLPCAVKAIEHNGRIAGAHFHVIWWCIGLLPVLCETIRYGRLGPRGAAPRAAARETPVTEAPVMRPGLSGLYIAIGYVSVVAHLCLMHWVYQGRFHAADLTPVLLGLAVAAAYGSPTKAIPTGDLRFARFWLPIAAVLCALADPRPLDLAVGLGGRFDVTSFHLAVYGAAAVYVYAYFWRWIRTIAIVATASSVLLFFGPTFRQMHSFTTAMVDDVLNFGWQIMPKTLLHWGMTAVGAAFAFLGIGALLSLSQPRQVIRDPENCDGPPG